MRKRTIALLGCGTVGRGLVDLLERNRALLAGRTGVELSISRILVRDLARERPGVDRALLTDRPEEVLSNGADVVVELMGGVEPARAFVERALEAGKNVVTANKALLAHAGADLFRLASARGVRIGFEASVGGGIPIVRALSSGLVGDRIGRICGILNGTSNYVLTRMAEDGRTLDEALAEARGRGFAEADPSLDLDGTDAAQKLAILAELAFGVRVGPGLVRVEGIRGIGPEDLRAAERLGRVLRPIAVARAEEGALDLRVHPAMLPRTHPLAHVRNEFNAVLLRGDAVGEMIFHGRGAGASPTASAVLSDIVELWRPGGEAIRVPEPAAARAVERPEGAFYLRFPIRDVPGVIGLIATALGNRGISISDASATLDPANPRHGSVTIVTHRCAEEALRSSIDEIARLPVLVGKPVAVRMEEE